MPWGLSAGLPLSVHTSTQVFVELHLELLQPGASEESVVQLTEATVGGGTLGAFLFLQRPEVARASDPPVPACVVWLPVSFCYNSAMRMNPERNG